MAIRDYSYCDARASKYFRLGGWDSTSGAKATKMISVDGYSHVCAYCGNRGLPLQPYFTGRLRLGCDTTVTGYTCVCKDAMDQLEIEEQVAQLKHKQQEELRLLLEKMPEVNKEVVSKIIKSKADELIKAAQRGNVHTRDMERFGLQIVKGD